MTATTFLTDAERVVTASILAALVSGASGVEQLCWLRNAVETPGVSR